MPFLLALQLWTTSHLQSAGTLLEGNWQSCQQPNGEWGERVFEGSYPFKYELHLGPMDEFALVKGWHTEHVEHDSRDNLLAPGYHAAQVDTWRGKRNWSALGLWVQVIAAGGSQDACVSWYVKVTRKEVVR